jgi:hypothetical protein
MHAAALGIHRELTSVHKRHLSHARLAASGGRRCNTPNKQIAFDFHTSWCESLCHRPKGAVPRASPALSGVCIPHLR